MSARSQAAARPFDHRVFVQPTSFQPTRPPDADRRREFQALYRELIEDEDRTRRICDDVVEAGESGRTPLVLTERNEHLDRLERGLYVRVPHLIVLRAGLGKRRRQAIADQLAAVPADASRTVLATGRYVGEGFDDPRLDTLFLTLPVSWRGTVAQYAGRLHRLHDSKREVRIYDYADLDVPMLARMFDRRCRGYEAIGYTVVLLASVWWRGSPRCAGRSRWGPGLRFVEAQLRRANEVVRRDQEASCCRSSDSGGARAEPVEPARFSR